MKANWITKKLLSGTIGISLLLSGTMARAAEDSSLQGRYEALLAEVAQLRQEVASLSGMVATVKTGTQASYQSRAEEIASIDEEESYDASESVRSPILADSSIPDFNFHLAGYADAGFATETTGNDTFTVGHFAPIFHYQYKDLILFEAELEFSLEQLADGSTETEVGIEYLSLDLFLNDYATLIVGKFISPIGNFQQNLHPSWINKLPTMPIGFGGGHHGSAAAPVAEVGLQLRGGFPAGGLKTNYSIFVGNGPRLILEEDAIEGAWEIEVVDTSGLVNDIDGNKAIGGRLGFLPIPNLEIGFSAAFADAGVSIGGGDAHSEGDEEDDHGEEAAPSSEDDNHAEEVAGININPRDYTVFGTDFYYNPGFLRNLVFRGEYIRTELGAGAATEDDPGKRSWEAWYLQGSYLISEYKLEPVLRYGQFTNDKNITRKQFAPGLNYRFANNVILKFAYEFNESEDIDSENNEDRFLVQMAFGF